VSEYELVDAFTSFQGLLQGWITAYFAGVTAYLVAAYLAGARLNQSQVAVMNLVFFIYAALCAVGAFGTYSRAIELAVEAHARNPARVFFASRPFLWLMTANLVAGIALSLKFMWDVRHRPQRSPVADDRQQ